MALKNILEFLTIRSNILSLFEMEGKVSAFLGIQNGKLTPNKFQLTQPGLIEKILITMQMDDCNGCDAPAATTPLHADLNGAEFNESWQYDSVLGMMMYLANNT